MRAASASISREGGLVAQPGREHQLPLHRSLHSPVTTYDRTAARFVPRSAVVVALRRAGQVLGERIERDEMLSARLEVL